jgi:hypothetical protein
MKASSTKSNQQFAPGARRAALVTAAVVALAACAYAGAQQPRRAAAPRPGVALQGIAAVAKAGRRAKAGPSANTGQRLRLAGSGFKEAVTVEFMGFAGSAFLINPVKVEAGGILLDVPASAVTGPVRLNDPSAGTSNAVTLQIVPTVTTLAPASASPGGRLLIDGTGFTHDAKVRFAGVAKPVEPRIVSPTRIDIAVPAGARTGPVTVLTSGGTSNPKQLAVGRPQGATRGPR